MIIDMPTVSMGNSGSVLPAEKVSYDNTTSGLEAENVQDAIDEVNSNFIYSTTPKKIGKWTDGRDVWAKTYHFVINGVVDSGTTYRHIIDANFGTNGEEFINATGRIVNLNDSGKPAFGVPYVYRSDFFCSFGTDAINGLKLIYQGSFNGRTADVTVEYIYADN